MMKKKAAALAALALAGVMILTACSSSEQEFGSADPQPKTIR